MVDRVGGAPGVLRKLALILYMIARSEFSFDPALFPQEKPQCSRLLVEPFPIAKVYLSFGNSSKVRHLVGDGYIESWLRQEIATRTTGALNKVLTRTVVIAA
jgi:hypothetical protein